MVPTAFYVSGSKVPFSVWASRFNDSNTSLRYLLLLLLLVHDDSRLHLHFSSILCFCISGKSKFCIS